MIIGISGKIGSGKDTAADCIQQLHPSAHRAAFALNVKKIVSILTNTSLETNLTREGKASIAPGFEEEGFTLGKIQQLVGEGMRHIVTDDVWIRSALTKGKSHHNLTVITDVRYPNEVEAIIARGGIVFRIVRPDVNFEDGRDMSHPSETALDDVDDDFFTEVINNDGSLESFKLKIEMLTHLHIS